MTSANFGVEFEPQGSGAKVLPIDLNDYTSKLMLDTMQRSM